MNVLHHQKTVINYTNRTDFLLFFFRLSDDDQLWWIFSKEIHKIQKQFFSYLTFNPSEIPKKYPRENRAIIHWEIFIIIIAILRVSLVSPLGTMFTHFFIFVLLWIVSWVKKEQFNFYIEINIQKLGSCQFFFHIQALIKIFCRMWQSKKKMRKNEKLFARALQ